MEPSRPVARGPRSTPVGALKFPGPPQRPTSARAGATDAHVSLDYVVPAAAALPSRRGFLAPLAGSRPVGRRFADEGAEDGLGYLHTEATATSSRIGAPRSSRPQSHALAVSSLSITFGPRSTIITSTGRFSSVTCAKGRSAIG